MKQKQILTDFNEPRWQNTNMESIKRIVNFLALKTLKGEMGHPPDSQPDRVINEVRMAISITEIHLEGNIIYGMVETLDTDLGRQAEEGFKNDKARMSIRASASRKNGKMEFTEISTWDIVKK